MAVKTKQTVHVKLDELYKLTAEKELRVQTFRFDHILSTAAVSPPCLSLSSRGWCVRTRWFHVPFCAGHGVGRKGLPQ